MVSFWIWLQAFQFCLKYNRKTEFRKLCDKLRKHLEDISKLTPQATNVSISKPETQQFNLDTRLVQLDSAIQMELWQVSTYYIVFRFFYRKTFQWLVMNYAAADIWSVMLILAFWNHWIVIFWIMFMFKYQYQNYLKIFVKLLLIWRKPCHFLKTLVTGRYLMKFK